MSCGCRRCNARAYARRIALRSSTRFPAMVISQVWLFIPITAASTPVENTVRCLLDMGRSGKAWDARIAVLIMSGSRSTVIGFGATQRIRKIRLLWSSACAGRKTKLRWQPLALWMCGFLGYFTWAFWSAWKSASHSCCGIHKTVDSVRLWQWHKIYGIHGSHSAAALGIAKKSLYYFIVLLMGSSSDSCGAHIRVYSLFETKMNKLIFDYFQTPNL